MTFDDRVRAALRDLVKNKHGRGYTTVARQMGRCHVWLLRKLDPKSADPRPMTLEDVDQVLEHLGEDPAEFLKTARAIRAP